MWSLRCLDEVLGELVDDLVAVSGDDALVVLDGDLLADVAEFVHDLPQGAALEHEQGRVTRPQGLEGQVGAAGFLPGFAELGFQGGLAHHRGSSGAEDHGFRVRPFAVPEQMVVNQGNEPVGDGHGAPAGVGLGPGDACRTTIRIAPVDGMAHGQAFGLQVDVLDLQAAQLAATEASDERGEYHRQSRVVGHVLRDQLEFQRRDRRNVLPGGSWCWRYGQDERVVADQRRGAVHAHLRGAGERRLQAHA